MTSLNSARLRVLPLFVGFVLLGGLVLATLWYATVRSTEVEASRRAAAIENKLDDIFSALLHAESGQRGYLLTGRPEYLVPYENARSALDGDFESLLQIIPAARRREPAIVDLKSLIDRKFTELKKTIDLKSAGRDAEALSLVGTDEGKTLMNGAHDAIFRLKSAEERIVEERQQASDTLSNQLQMGLAATGLLVILLGGFAYAVNQRQLSSLMAAHAELEAANEQLLNAAAAREKIEAQLRQSQKMEAIGQLTGGIAHDFNNMLSIVIGSLHLMQRRLSRGQTEDALGLVAVACEGADRAATLTNRLLAFSRQQPLAPEPLDVNRFVGGMSDLLMRSLGEAIQVETVLAGGLWRSHADPNQLENTILNLCINARDAMPDGGKLTIETVNAHLDEAYSAAHVDVPPGQYVLIAVSDTGGGMASDVVARAFDPFFTTKMVGKGTGLGLSQVFGFVKQSGGHVKIYSEPGRGTSVKLYLPRYFGDSSARESAPAKLSQASGGAGELVLVVEDDDRVRQTTVESLRELGYAVRHAPGAEAALRLLDGDPDIQLLFTDIVMPEVDGRKLADEALRRNPDLKVLFTTGYTRNAIVHNGVLDPGVHLITKPFTLEQLAAKVRGILGAA